MERRAMRNVPDRDEAARLASVARGAVRQAGRHERAIEACLAELSGAGTPDHAVVAVVMRRARRHALHARELTALAARVNPEPDAAPSLAASLERQERNVLRLAGPDQVMGGGTDASLAPD